MKVSLVQTKSNLSASYIALSEGEEKYRAEIPFNFSGRYADFLKNGRLLYRLRFDFRARVKSTIKSRTDAKLYPFTIRNNADELLGHICVKRSKAFWGYMYYEYEICERRFNAYEIGLGKNGIKIPIYEDDRQVALIEKGTVVYDNKDIYDIYTPEESYIEAASIFTVYYDFIRFGHYGENVYKSKQAYYLYSTNKELKKKFDPMFSEEKC